MKTSTNLLRRNLKIYIAIISIICTPYVVFGIEPIGTIGQPLPEQHAFLSNDKIIRVVPTHIQVVDSISGRVIDEFGTLSSTAYVVFSPTGSHLAIRSYSSDSDGYYVSIWDVNTREQIAKWNIEDRVGIAAFSPTQPLLATTKEDQVSLWNWQTGEIVGTMTGDRHPLEFCYYRENGRTCGGSFRNESVFTPDGKYLIISARRPVIKVWNVETRELEGHLEGHIGNWVEGIAISPDGTRLASFERSNLIYVWDIESRQLLWKDESGSGWISDLTFSQNSQHLYVATRTVLQRKLGDTWEFWDDQVRVWDVKSK